MKDSEKGDPGLRLARRISSLIGKLLRRGATSYREYSGVETSGFMLVARPANGLTAEEAEGPEIFSCNAKYE